jgi:hypothetical protein
MLCCGEKGTSEREGEEPESDNISWNSSGLFESLRVPCQAGTRRGKRASDRQTTQRCDTMDFSGKVRGEPGELRRSQSGIESFHVGSCRELAKSCRDQNCRVIGQNPPPIDNYELEASKHSPAARITRILRQHSEALVMAQLVKHRDCDSPSPLSSSFIASRLHTNHTLACKGPSGCE